MAQTFKLINCPSCGKRVVSDAKACAHCGQSFVKPQDVFPYATLADWARDLEVILDHRYDPQLRPQFARDDMMAAYLSRQHPAVFLLSTMPRVHSQGVSSPPPQPGPSTLAPPPRVIPDDQKPPAIVPIVVFGIIAIFITALITSAPGFSPSPSTHTDPSTVEYGWSEDQVRQSLGSPDSTQRIRSVGGYKLDCLYYGKSQICLEGGRVGLVNAH